MKLAASHSPPGAKFAIVYSPVLNDSGQIIDQRDGALRAFREWCAANDTPILALNSIYRTAGPETCYRDPIHPSEHGTEVAAQAIESWVLFEGFRK